MSHTHTFYLIKCCPRPWRAMHVPTHPATSISSSERSGATGGGTPWYKKWFNKPNNYSNDGDFLAIS